MFKALAYYGLSVLAEPLDRLVVKARDGKFRPGSVRASIKKIELPLDYRAPSRW